MINSWNNFKELILIDKQQVCTDIISFYFKSKDGSKLVKPIAGQFLPFKIKTSDKKYKDVIRTYTLSMCPNEDIYRISVKRVPGGLISNYLHDNLNIGDSIEAMVPTGLFRIKNTSNDLVLLSGGIGVTPILAMAYDESKKRNNIHIIQAVQNSEMHPFREDIQNLCSLRNLQNTVLYSNPLEQDKLGTDFDYTGFITKDFLQNNVNLKADFYFCGPPIFMESLKKSLLELGVSEQQINYELF